MEAVGVRELRQNLSVYLRRVRSGESLRVTDRGVAVAVLTPLPEHEDAYERLAANGRLIPATTELEALGVPSAVPVTMRVSDALDELRRD